MALTKKSNVVKFNDKYSYEIFDDGYDIYLDGQPHITQREPYAHVYAPEGTYEENALLQLESLTAPVDENPEEEEPAEA